MKKPNKLLSILLSVIMLVSLFPQASFADAACSHNSITDNERSGICKCNDCGKTLVRLSGYDVTTWASLPKQYFETIDEAIAAVPEFDETYASSYYDVDGVLRWEYQYSYEVRFYEDIELDHDLVVKDKVFDLAPNPSGYMSKLSFTDGHSMRISRDKINDSNSVTLYQIHNIGNITLEKNALVFLSARPTIDKLTLADKTADLRYMANSWYTSEPQLKIKKLEVTAQDCTIGDFLNYEDKTLAYRTYYYNDERNDYFADQYVNDISITEISDVTILKAPIQNFTAELDETSKNLIYPGSFTINAGSTCEKYGVELSYEAVLPENLSCTPTVTKIDDTNTSFAFDNVPEGTYEIGITAIAKTVSVDDSDERKSDYEITKYVPVTVSKISVENNNDITIKIKGQDAPCNITYTSGLQVKESDVSVYDKGVDVTGSFDISVPQTLLLANTTYPVVAAAKVGSSYKGQISTTFTVVKATPVKGVDFTVILPSSLVYDGTQKSVTVTSAKGLTAREIGYAKKLPDESFDNPTAEAPTEPGTYKVYVIIGSTLLYNEYNDCAAEFTIEKADVKFEYTIPFDAKAWYYYEEDKKVAGKIVNADASAVNAKVPAGNVRIENNGSAICSAVLNENGEFELDIPLLPVVGVGVYNLKIVYDGNENYSGINEDHNYIIGTNYLKSFNVSNTEHRYAPGVERKITVSSPDSRFLTNDDFDVKYYLVDENSGKLVSTEPVAHTISAGRYLYVISLKNKNTRNYIIEREYSVEDTKIPDMSHYKNTGFMDIKAASEAAQKPISFAKGVVNIKSGERYTNTLKNENASAVTYESSDTEVAYVDRNGEITAKKSGTATITATSTMEGATPVYASYTVNVKKELTKESFEIIAEAKAYDGSKAAAATATLKDEFKVDPTDVVKATITAEFDSPNAGERTVSYEITDISGKNADKYVLSDVYDDLKGTVNALIEKAVVTVICPKVTTRTFDGSAHTADISAMANGRIFDTSNYNVKYSGENTAVNVGEYTISIELSDAARENYTVEPFDAKLKIVNAAQDIFAIENVPENVYYGDTFKVSAAGANGSVAYEITDGAEFAEISADGKVAVKGVGKVTIKATSTKDGYADRTALKTFETKKRILNPSAVAVNREYSGENGVDVEITLGNIVSGDSVTASAAGSMINADAGSGKIVYVNKITLSDNEKYTLSTNTLQITVNITPIEIDSFTISAIDKKYDGTENAQVNVTEISNVIDSDKGFVSVAGTAKFDSANAGSGKTVTFTTSGLSGAKAQNYVLGKTSATANASIEPLKVNFTVGQTTFVYDGKDKKINVSATDENGRIFKDFTVNYNKTPNAADTYTATISLNNENYITDQGEITVTVENATQSQLVIAGLPGTVEYGDTFKLEAFGGADGGTVSWKVTDENNASISHGGEVTIKGTGKIEITATKSSDNYADISSKVIFTAVQKNITFELGDLEQTFGSTLGKVNVTPSDPQITDGDFEVTYSGNAAFPTKAGKYKVEVKATNPNYKGSARDTLVIGKAKATGKIQINSSFTYGDTISASVTDIPEGTTEKITYAGTGIYIPQEEAPKNAGNYTAIAEITGENYETLTLTKNFTIEKAILTVKAQNASRAYGDANPIFNLIYDGFKNGENESVFLYEPTATVEANSSSAVGEYNITVSGGYAENYKFAYDNTGVLEITGATGSGIYIMGSNTLYVNDKAALSAFYGNTKINAAWESSDTDIAEVDGNGTVTAKSAGTATITATADSNYGNAAATFDITVKKSGITLVPTELVKTYNGERQEISFSPVSGFTPEIGENVIVDYVLTTDPTVTEPIKAGTYSVTYTISDKSFAGGGTTTMYIAKANITVVPKNITKVYGDEPKFELIPSMQTTLVSDDNLKELAKNARFTCNGKETTANVGKYDITAVLGTYENDNLNFTVDGMGELTVTKAPLTVKVKDVSREYGAENPALEVEYEGFKNGETADVLGGNLELSYNGITAESEAKSYPAQTSASGLTSDNYDISYTNGNVTITPIVVTASAGTARRSNITILFDKAINGLTKDNFTVKAGENTVELAGVTEGSNGTTYVLTGSFTVGTAHTVEITYANNNYSITGTPLTITPSGSSGGGGGGGSSSSSSYTVTFETNGGGKITSQTVKKNETAKKPTEPTKDGFVFGGWYSDKNLTAKYDFPDKITKNITLYAKWSENTKTGEEKQLILTIGEKAAQVFGQMKTNDVAPKIVNSRTMLPARFVAESLGAEVLWDGEKELVTIKGKNLKTNEDVIILIYIGSDVAYVNGKEIKLDSAAFVENDRTYTPIRFISEELGADVSWIEAEQKVVITKQK